MVFYCYCIILLFKERHQAGNIIKYNDFSILYETKKLGFFSLRVSKCWIASCGWEIKLSALRVYQVPYFACRSSQQPALAVVWQTYLSTEQLPRKKSINFIHAICELEPFKLGKGHALRTVCTPIRSTWCFYHYTLWLWRTRVVREKHCKDVTERWNYLGEVGKVLSEAWGFQLQTRIKIALMCYFSTQRRGQSWKLAKGGRRQCMSGKCTVNHTTYHKLCMCVFAKPAMCNILDML